jgi:hypothetical protein
MGRGEASQPQVDCRISCGMQYTWVSNVYLPKFIWQTGTGKRDFGTVIIRAGSMFMPETRMPGTLGYP